MIKAFLANGVSGELLFMCEYREFIASRDSATIHYSAKLKAVK